MMLRSQSQRSSKWKSSDTLQNESENTSSNGPPSENGKPFIASVDDAVSNAKTKTAGLQDTRAALSDKSNITRPQLRSVLDKKSAVIVKSDTQVHVDVVQTTPNDNIRLSSSTTDNENVQRPLENPTTKITATTHKEKTADEALVKDFFDDNKTRYPRSAAEEVEPTPILPIIVPERLRHRFRGVVASGLGDKRSSETIVDHDNDHPQESKFHGIDTTKKSKYVHTTSNTLQAWPQTSRREKFFAGNKHFEPLVLKAYPEALEREAKLGSYRHRTESKHDDWHDPMLASVYVDDIFNHFLEVEKDVLADPFYATKRQHEVTWRMRSVLMDWVVEIHFIFQLLPETLYLAVNMIDRFLSARPIALGKLQLVGVTALFIATKFEEIAAPNVTEFLSMTDKTVKASDLLKAERFMLQVLDFKLCYPNPLYFLRRTCEVKDFDVHVCTLSEYFLEVSCVDHRFIGYRPSQLAEASALLAEHMLTKKDWSDQELQKTYDYAEGEVKTIVNFMLDYLAQPVQHDAFFKKWSSRRFMKASVFVRDWVNRFYMN
ncbi:cyclin-like protein [Radiomyces spectabilis]|uniref:cyclin-like protein n=1 Tax=Radiomyces spectabilis TaxID=64574 RepID=UPI00221EB83D|nr:cyclin-like protein [Radiomyces spectabilis]KAI8369298.1 cyclin-like protein [Radiomyces spectabilis]